MGIDWVTVSSLATAGATLVVAVATFASVRLSIRMARNAEQALQLGIRPVLFPSRSDSAAQRVRWGDDHHAWVSGNQAVLEETNGVIYLAMSIRNVGAGIGLLFGWRIEPYVRPADLPASPLEQRRAFVTRPESSDFRTQAVDIYVAPGDQSFWFGAIRAPDDPGRSAIQHAVAENHTLMVDLLYGDQEGGQRTISRFVLSRDPDDPDQWLCGVVRHWFLDREDPR